MATHSSNVVDPISPNDIIIPVMGITGAGKSSFIARCTGHDVGIGHGLKSCTKEVTFGTFLHNGRKIRLIDTPGFDDSDEKRDDSFTRKEIALWLAVAYDQKPPLLLSGIVYLHPINEPGGRMRGSTRNNLNMFKAMWGDEPLSCLVLATTMWGKIQESEGQRRQEELSNNHWSHMVRNGSTVVRHDDARDSALRIIDHIISQRTRVPLKIQRQLVDEDKSVEETNAGQQLKSKLINELARVESRVRTMRIDLEEALAENNNAAANEALEEQAKQEAKARAKDAELQTLKIKYEELYKQKLDQMEKADSERQRKREAYQNKMAELRKEQEANQERQWQLKSVHHPPWKEIPALANRNEILKEQERQMEIERYNNEQRQQQEKQRLQDLFQQQTMEMSKKQPRTSKKGVVYGAIGAAAGTAAVVAACTVM